MKRLLPSLLVLLLTLIAGYFILSLWRGVHLYRSDPSKEDLLNAIRIEPSNPDPYYRLGLFYLWDVQETDFKESLKYLGKAIERNPLEQDYWLSMAKVFQRMGDRKASDQALEKAIFLFPTGYTGRWVAGNLFLQRGDFEKALPQFSYILDHYPSESHLVYDIFLRTGRSPDFILEKLVPGTPVSLDQYISYLYGIGDKETVMKTWQKKASLGYRSSRDETLRHIEYLISKGLFAGAFEVWKARLKEEGISLPSGGNLITNGKFEREKVLGGGFDWKITAVKGAEVSIDPTIGFEGKRSLRVRFSGKENIDFQHIFQYVSWKPDTAYVLKANMRTSGVTTKSGLKMEVVGIGPSLYAASESLTGDNAWKELTVAFRTPAGSQGGLVRVRREKIDKFDRFLAGTVWLDNVQLKEK